MRMTRKSIAVAGLSALALVAVSGCSGASTDPDKVVLRYFDFQFTEPVLGKILTSLVEEFEEEHPNIDVRIEDPPFTQYEAKLVAEGRAGRAPDVVKLLDGSFTNVQSAGILRDLTPFVDAEDAGFLDSYYPVGTDLVTVDGTLYAIPVFISPYLLQYNPDLLAQYSVETAALAKWDTFLAAVEKISADSDGDVSGYAAQGLKGETTVQRLLTWFFNNGAEILTPDLKQAAFNSEAGKEAFRFWAALAAAGGGAPATTGPGEAREAFASEAVAMFQSLSTGPSIVTSINPDMEGKSALAPMPSPTGEIAPSNFQGFFLSIAENTEHPEEAWELVKWLTSKQAGIEAALGADYFSARIDVASDPEVASDPGYQATALAVEHVTTFPHIAAWPQISGFLADAMQQVLSAGVDPDVALDEAAEKTNALLNG